MVGNHDDDEQFFSCFTHLGGRRQYFVRDAAAGCLFVFVDVTESGSPHLAAQTAFLTGVLTDPTHAGLPHRFVFFHVPPYTTGQRGACVSARAWAALFQQTGVDIVFSGHTHAYERYLGVPSGPDVNYVVTGGGGGYAQEPGDDPVPPYFVKAEYEPHFVEVKVGSDGRIRVDAYRTDREFLDHFEIEDAPPTR